MTGWCWEQEWGKGRGWSQFRISLRVHPASDFIGKGQLGGEQQGKGTRENCSAMWRLVSSFMLMGLVSGFSLVNYSDPGSFLGEGNGTPLQYSCLANPMDGGAW